MTVESWPWFRSWLKAKLPKGQGLIRLCLGTLLWGAMMLPTPLAAQSFNAGNKLYTKGDFKAAANAFKAALKSENTPAEKAKLHKYAGICEYMLGKTEQASLNFKKALKYNPSIAISQNEVLDESVIGFFNKAKAEAGNAKPAPAAAPLKPAKKPEAPAAATVQVQPPQHGDKALKSKFGKPTKLTYLRVVSNVQDATVMIDGILSGNTNTLVEADPGTVVIEVSSNGFLSRKIRTKIIPNRENTLTVNLAEKPKPKPKAPPPAAVAAAKPSQAPGAAPAKKARGKNQKRGDLPDPGGEELFGDGGEFALDGGGRDLAAEFSADAEAPKKPKRKLPKAAPAVQPQAGAVAGGETALAAKLPPQQFPQAQPGFSAPQPVSEPPLSQAQPANGMALNGNQSINQMPVPPMPQQPQQQMQQQFPQQQPMMQQQMPQMLPQQPQQQMAQQPVVNQGTPQAPQYAQPYAPPPPPPPPADVQQVANNPQGAAAAQQQQQTPGIKKKVKKRKKLMAQNTDPSKQVRMTKTSSSSGSIFISLLPFGAGQFQNGSTLLGSGFAAAEVLALGYWYYNKNLADEAVAKAESYYTEVDNSSDSEDEKTKKKKDFYDETNTYVTQKRQQQYVGLFGFGALWVGGAVESIIDAPQPAKVRKVRGTRVAEVDAAFAEEFAQQEEDEDAEPTELDKKFKPSLMPELNFGLLVDKERTSTSGVPTTGLGLAAEWNF